MDYETGRASAAEYGDKLCESIKIISEALMEGLQFDKTIECVIVDDSKKDQGTYIVSDGLVQFTAYSENTKYTKNTSVYVTIPNGDYSKDKIIAGKKVKGEENIPFIYSSPLSHLVDVTGNLIQSNKREFGLTANTPSEYYEIAVDATSENYSDYYIEIEDGKYKPAENTTYDINTQYYQEKTDGLSKLIFEKTFTEPYYNFDRLGLQANFQSWLREFDCILGNYGLKLTVDFIPEGSLDQNNNKTTITRELYLDTNDMLGNPYAFDSYYNQEKIFDISPFGGISSIKLEFFQDANSFYTKNGELIPYKDDFGNFINFSNLFVKDCRVCLGYDIENYNSEFVRLYSFNPKTYTSEVEDQQNQKNISLKWVHIDDEGNQIQMDRNSSITYPYKIKWYRYKLGQPSADEYSGPGWTSPDDSFVVDENDNFKAILHPDISTKETEQIKVIILFGPDPKPGEVDTRKIYHSNILSFNNTQPVINSATLDAVQALSLVCQDVIDNLQYDTYGSYLIYDQGNQLIDKGQADVLRLIGCKFDLSSTNTDDMELLEKKASITWRFPIENTMIKPIDSYVKETITVINDSGEEEEKETGFGLITIEQEKVETAVYGMPVFKYKINNILNTFRSNNIIECTVSLNNVNYHASKELRFGQSGTAGTDWTFSIDFEEGNAILFDVNDNGDDFLVEKQSYNIISYLQDSSGRILDLSDKNIEWSFVNPQNYKEVLSDSTKITITPQNKSLSATLVPQPALTINDLFILKATLKDWEDYELTTFLTIPLKKVGYNYLSGANRIVYLTDGYPQYDSSYYKLNYAKNSDDDIRSFIYERIPSKEDIDNDNLEIYLPEVKHITKNSGNISLGYQLKPVSMYVDNLPVIGVQAKYNDKVVWTQPILIIQNRYPAAMINKWNGKDLVLDENNSTIISQMIGAGRKEGDNSFSGVLIGDWRGKTTANSILDTYTGIFGFNKGEMSYSFTHDGKATIGKASKGQIQFDGNNSQITSNLYNTSGNNNGMVIDLDDGYIKLNHQNGNIQIDASSSSYPFQIGGSNFQVDWNGNFRANSAYIKGELSGNCYVSHGGSDKKLTEVLNDIANAASNAQSAADAATELAISVATAQSAAESAQNDVDYLLRKTNNGACIETANGAAKLWVATNGSSGCNCHFTIGGGLNVDQNLWVEGNIGASGNISDIRVKENINYCLQPLKNLFFNLKPFSYNLIGDNVKRLGFSVQDIEKLNINLKEKDRIDFTSLVSNNRTRFKEINDLKQINYNNFIGLNTYMIQEAYKEIDQLKQEIKELKEQINNE